MSDEIQLDAQITPAHVLAVLKEQVIPRLVELEATVKEAGLNGHTPLLKAFLEQYAATYVSRQAWQTVRGDILHRLRFLAPGKHWLGLLLAGALGALGWELVTAAHLPWLG